MNGRLVVHVELHLHDKRDAVKFGNRLVVCRSLDFRVNGLVRDCRYLGLVAVVCRIARFGFFGWRRGHALLNRDGRYDVACLVVVREVPEWSPDRNNLPAQLAEYYRADVFAVFHGFAEPLAGTVVLDDGEEAVRVVRVHHNGSDRDAAFGETFLRIDVLALQQVHDLFAEF